MNQYTEFAALTDDEGAAVIGGALGPILIGITVAVVAAVVNDVIKNWDDVKKNFWAGLDGK